MTKAVVPSTLEDGKCLRCGKPRIINMQKGVPVEAYLDDEFCSARCARIHHGNPLDSDLKSQKRNGIGKRPLS